MVFDSGWVVKIGRGLDIYKPPEGTYSFIFVCSPICTLYCYTAPINLLCCSGKVVLGAFDLSQRKCLETTVDIFFQKTWNFSSLCEPNPDQTRPNSTKNNCQNWQYLLKSLSIIGHSAGNSENLAIISSILFSCSPLQYSSSSLFSCIYFEPLDAN